LAPGSEAAEQGSRGMPPSPPPKKKWGGEIAHHKMLAIKKNHYLSGWQGNHYN